MTAYSIASCRALTDVKSKARLPWRLLIPCLVLLEPWLPDVAFGQEVSAKTVAASSAPPASQKVRAGRQLFLAQCAKCHEADGKGGKARGLLPDIPDFTDASWQSGRTDMELFMGILDGKGTSMPAFRGRMSEEWVRHLVVLVRAFSPAKKSPDNNAAANLQQKFANLQDHYDQLQEELRKLRDAPDVGRLPNKMVQPCKNGSYTVHGAEPFAPWEEAIAPERGHGEEENDVVPGSFGEKLLTWVGRFHLPAVHFPLALLATAALAELFLMITGGSCFDAVSRFCLMAGAATAIVAALLGWLHGGFRWTDDSWILATHRWLGTATAVVALLVMALGNVSRRSAKFQVCFRLALFAAAASVMLTGFFGGALVFGLDHYSWPR